MWPAKDLVTVVLSGVAFLLSGATAWATLLRRGQLYMAQPSLIYFGSDAAPRAGGGAPPKVYLRTTLFSTGKRGHIVENMYVTLANDHASEVFNIWVFGETDLARGSGLFVGEQGSTANHHFLLSSTRADWLWTEGTYSLAVHANLIPAGRQLTLHESTLVLDSSTALALSQGDCGVYFDWRPESQQYERHVKGALPPSPQAAV